MTGNQGKADPFEIAVRTLVMSGPETSNSEHMRHLSLKTSAEAEYVEGKCPRLREAVTQKYQPFYFSKPMGG